MTEKAKNPELAISPYIIQPQVLTYYSSQNDQWKASLGVIKRDQIGLKFMNIV